MTVMARRNRTYLVSFKLQSEPSPRSEIVRAHDSACALGLVLDELGDDADADFEWLLIRSEKKSGQKKSTATIRSLDSLPPVLLKAYYEGLS